MQLKSQPLDLLKVVIHQEDLGENWTAAAADHLCAIHLQTIVHTTATTDFLFAIKSNELADGLNEVKLSFKYLEIWRIDSVNMYKLT